MNIQYRRLGVMFLLTLAPATSLLAYSFGAVPLNDVLLAAETVNYCPSLSTKKLAALILAPTWVELNDGVHSLTPAPMALGRGDSLVPSLSPPNLLASERVFWHPGVGMWQMDDSGLGDSTANEKFDSRQMAFWMAGILSDRYCTNPSYLFIFQDWFACASYPGALDRDRCGQIVDEFMSLPGSIGEIVYSDEMVSRLGGASARTCRFGNPFEAFDCLYVSPLKEDDFSMEIIAEGHTGSWIYEPYEGSGLDLLPLAKPFYVFSELSDSGIVEWRYWMAADTHLDRDYWARRLYGQNSRHGLDWSDSLQDPHLVLCDVDTGRGGCLQCVPTAAVGSGVTVSASCAPEPPDYPTVFTEEVANLTSDAAILRLSVNPHGTLTTAWFRWGMREDSLPHVVPVEPFSVGVGEGFVFRSYTLTNLDCDSRYFFQAWADGYGLPISGAVRSFRTQPCGGGELDPNQLIENGDFTDDDTHWTTTGSFQADDRFNSYRSSPGYAYLARSDGSWGNSLSGALYQEVTIPAEVDTASLEFWYWISTKELSSAPPRDVILASIRDEDGDYLYGLNSYSNWDAYPGGYRSAEFDVSQFAGETIQIHFSGTTSASDATVFRIDDVTLTVDYDDGGGGGGGSVGFDLEVFDPDVDDSTPGSGREVRFSFSTTNVGDRISPDDVPVSYYIDGMKVGEDNEESTLAPGEVDGEAETLPVPDTPGHHEVWACLKSYPEEQNTSNNCTDKIDLTVEDSSTYGPDMVIVQTTTSQTTLLAGEVFDMTAVVRNVGEEYVLTPSLVRFLATLDGELDHEDLMLEADTINSPSVGNERTASETMEAPVEPGNYLLGACVKFLGDEKDETNNCSPDPFILQVLPSGCQPQTISLSGIVVTSSEVHEACQSIEIGPSTSVEAGGSLSLNAPRVVLRDGFRVYAGGELKVVTQN